MRRLERSARRGYPLRRRIFSGVDTERAGDSPRCLSPQGRSRDGLLPTSRRARRKTRSSGESRGFALRAARDLPFSQCGFSSTAPRKMCRTKRKWRKLERIVELPKSGASRTAKQATKVRTTISGVLLVLEPIHDWRGSSGFASVGSWPWSAATSGHISALGSRCVNGGYVDGTTVLFNRVRRRKFDRLEL